MPVNIVVLQIPRVFILVWPILKYNKSKGSTPNFCIAKSAIQLSSFALHCFAKFVAIHHTGSIADNYHPVMTDIGFRGLCSTTADLLSQRTIFHSFFWVNLTVFAIFKTNRSRLLKFELLCHSYHYLLDTITIKSVRLSVSMPY